MKYILMNKNTILLAEYNKSRINKLCTILNRQINN